MGVEKDVLLKRYRFGTEQALARADFLNTNEIVTVQAFVLFLVCVRRYDGTRFVWSLTALAVRIAQSLGLHRDGTKFNLSPFDTEMVRFAFTILNPLFDDSPSPKTSNTNSSYSGDDYGGKYAF